MPERWVVQKGAQCGFASNIFCTVTRCDAAFVCLTVIDSAHANSLHIGADQRFAAVDVLDGSTREVLRI